MFMLLNVTYKNISFWFIKSWPFSNLARIWENWISNSWWGYNTKKIALSFKILSSLFNLENKRDSSKLLGSKQLVSQVHLDINSL